MGGIVISDAPWWLRPWLFIIFTRSEADISDTALRRLLLVSAANSAAALWRLVLTASLRAVLRQLVRTAALRAVRRRQILIRAENWTAAVLRRRLIIRAEYWTAAAHRRLVLTVALRAALGRSLIIRAIGALGTALRFSKQLGQCLHLRLALQSFVRMRRRISLETLLDCSNCAR